MKTRCFTFLTQVLLFGSILGVAITSHAAVLSDSGDYSLEGMCSPQSVSATTEPALEAMGGMATGNMASCRPNQAWRTNNPIIKAVVEAGFLGVLDHKIQFGQNGTYFSYNQRGGQDTLFPVTRWSIETSPWPKNTLIFLYQPLDLTTQNKLTEPLVVDAVTFPAATPMAFHYSFPFYRLSYLYDFSSNPACEWSGGLSFQIRNATIEFRDQAGTQFTRNSNIGLVPLLKFRWKKQWDNGWWLGSEIDGIYAPVSYLNGSDTEIVGALLDASARVGVRLQQQDIFLNVRYLGGGAVGTNPQDDEISDGYVKNWLHFLIISLGFSTSWF